MAAITVQKSKIAIEAGGFQLTRYLENSTLIDCLKKMMLVEIMS
jgi:hypothetical protein